MKHNTGRLLVSLLFLIPVVNPASTPSRALNDNEKENTEYLSELEREILQELNAVRANPQRYIALLEDKRQFYVGKELRLPGKSVVLTSEGVASLNEAIEFLRTAAPLPPLSSSRGLSLGAKDHVKDLALTGLTGHTGSDGSSTMDRVSRYGTWSHAISEILFYRKETAREIVLDWIIDDGVASRGHRGNIFNPDYRIVGVACGSRTGSNRLTVIVFTGDFQERAATSPAKR